MVDEVKAPEGQNPVKEPEGSNPAEAETPRAVSTDDLLAAAHAGEEQEGFAQYASPSIARLKIGPYAFENGVLRVPSERVEHFETLLNGASIRTQQAVRKIDREGGEAVAKRFLAATKGTHTSGVDTTANTVAAPRPGEGEPPKPLETK